MSKRQCGDDKLWRLIDWRRQRGGAGLRGVERIRIRVGTHRGLHLVGR
jgi:hypothetical protein